MKRNARQHEINYWPGIADCMLGFFMIALLLGITSKVVELLPMIDEGKPESSETIILRLKNENEQLTRQLKTLEAELAQLRENYATLEKRCNDLVARLEAEADRRKQLEVELREAVSKRDEIAAKLTEVEKKLAEVEQELARVRDQLGRIFAAAGIPKGDADALVGKIDQLRKDHDKPPIIDLAEAKNFTFVKGKADLTQEFRERLHQNEFPQLLDIVKKYESVDTIEIIGHTDSTPVDSKGNLDNGLNEVVCGSARVVELVAGSNADLGLMRALAVMEEWKKWSDNRLPAEIKNRDIQVRCYSAAHGIPPAAVNGKVNDESARRIEIRFTQLRLPG